MKSRRGSSSLTSVVLLMVLSGCGSDATSSTEYVALEQQHAEVVAELEAAEEEYEALEQQYVEAVALAGAPEELPPIVAAFKTAFESGELEAIRDLFTDDGILTTSANVHELYWGNTSHLGTWDMDGTEFQRMSSIHQGELFITDVVEVGPRAVAFDWAWEDFGAGTALLHLRGGEIAVAVLATTGVEIYPQNSE